jgi:S1-C subfamily serine protease
MARAVSTLFRIETRENLHERVEPRQPWPMRTLLALPVAIALSACGGATPRAAVVHAPLTPSPAAARPASAPPDAPLDHALARSAVHAIVSQGLGYFLQRVDLDDQPVFAGHKFHGFRIARLRDAQFWDGVDLKAGDVVTGVNGFPIERPEQALTVFDSLEVASELRVAYEREGQTRELVYGIVDDR